MVVMVNLEHAESASETELNDMIWGKEYQSVYFYLRLSTYDLRLILVACTYRWRGLPINTCTTLLVLYSGLRLIN